MWIHRLGSTRRLCRLIACVVFATGCAGAPAYRSSARGRRSDEGQAVAWRQVRLVGDVPPGDRFRLVGKVDGITREASFVEAARAARIDIRMQAVRLGATIVKIDTIRIPPESPRTIAPRVLLVGRAYAPLPVHPRAARRRAAGPRVASAL